MRTTVVLNDKLVVEAKRLAAARNTTLSEIINEALRERLTRSPVSRSNRPFRMPVFQGPGPQVDTSPAELARVGEKDELQPYPS